MVNISAQRINEKSPYLVETVNEKSVAFTTDFGVRYVVGFDSVEVMTSAEVYEFAIINVNNKKSPRDPKLRDTIMAVVLDFFLSSERAMLYFCETGDGKQSMRNRLFAYWLERYTEYNKFFMVSDCVVDEEGVPNYVTLIIRSDHPKRKELVNEFMATVSALNSKP